MDGGGLEVAYQTYHCYDIYLTFTVVGGGFLKPLGQDLEDAGRERLCTRLCPQGLV